ncbi:hypothetical protein ACHAWF_005013 [Thalassiosira exigua]
MFASWVSGPQGATPCPRPAARSAAAAPSPRGAPQRVHRTRNFCSNFSISRPKSPKLRDAILCVRKCSSPQISRGEGAIRLQQGPSGVVLPGFKNPGLSLLRLQIHKVEAVIRIHFHPESCEK